MLNLIIAQHLIERFPDANEGGSEPPARAPGQRRAPGAAGRRAGSSARCCVLGPGELKSGGFRRQSILADALEALCGAIYPRRRPRGSSSRMLARLECGLPDRGAAGELKDAKTRLQEHLQSRSLPLPRYSIEQRRGRAACADLPRELRGATPWARAPQGDGSSRRRAEQAAAAARARAAPNELADPRVSFAAASPRWSAGPTSASRRCSTRWSGRSSASSRRGRRPPAIASSACCTCRDAQIAFVDTPGLHLGQRRALNKAMNRTATAALDDADLVVLVVEALQVDRRG